MSKTAFIFPGQGAQYTGMGKDFYEEIPVCREMIDLAGEVTCLNMPALLFEENEELNITEYTQIAMLSVEVAILKALEAQGVKADVTAGLSLGEYAACVCAGTLLEKDAFLLVRKRGILMQEAVPSGGAMAAVMGTGADLIEEICEKTEGIVSIANYNCPGQIVITGEKEAVERASEALKEAGARRIVPLKVSGPFHSAMLEQAGEALGEVLDAIEVKKPEIPYVTNVDASIVTDTTRTKELLKEQVYSSVLWEQSVRAMIADGVDVFVEIGPGKTLSGFMRKIDRNVKMFRIGTMEDIDKTVEAIKEL